MTELPTSKSWFRSPRLFFLDAPKEHPGTCFVKNDDYAVAVAEIERLTTALSRANANHERFEREWYLRGDEIERLQLQVTELSMPWAQLAKKAQGDDGVDTQTYITRLFKRCEDQKRELARLQRPEFEPLVTPAATQADMDRIFDSWFNSLRSPPNNYLEIFAAGYAAALLRPSQPPSASRYKVNDRVEWTNAFDNTFQGSVFGVADEPRYIIKFDDGTMLMSAKESELRTVPTKCAACRATTGGDCYFSENQPPNCAFKTASGECDGQK